MVDHQFSEENIHEFFEAMEEGFERLSVSSLEELHEKWQNDMEERAERIDDRSDNGISFLTALIEFALGKELAKDLDFSHEENFRKTKSLEFKQNVDKKLLDTLDELIEQKSIDLSSADEKNIEDQSSPLLGSKAPSEKYKTPLPTVIHCFLASHSSKISFSKRSN